LVYQTYVEKFNQYEIMIFIAIFHNCFSCIFYLQQKFSALVLTKKLKNKSMNLEFKL